MPGILIRPGTGDQRQRILSYWADAVAEGHNTLHFGPGHWEFSGQLLFQAQTVHLRAQPGATFKSTTAAQNQPILVSGTLSGTQHLLNDVAQGTTTLTLSGGGSITPGWYLLMDSFDIGTHDNGQLGRPQIRRQIVQVVSSSGGTVNISEPTNRSFSAANTARLQPYTLLPSLVTVSGIVLECTNSNGGVCVHHARNVEVSDCEVFNMASEGVNFDTIKGGTIYRPIVRNHWAGGQGYGPIAYRSQDIEIHDSQAVLGMRHGAMVHSGTIGAKFFRCDGIDLRGHDCRDILIEDSWGQLRAGNEQWGFGVHNLTVRRHNEFHVPRKEAEEFLVFCGSSTNVLIEDSQFAQLHIGTRQEVPGIPGVGIQNATMRRVIFRGGPTEPAKNDPAFYHNEHGGDRTILMENVLFEDCSFVMRAHEPAWHYLGTSTTPTYYARVQGDLTFQGCQFGADNAYNSVPPMRFGSAGTGLSVTFSGCTGWGHTHLEIAQVNQRDATPCTVTSTNNVLRLSGSPANAKFIRTGAGASLTETGAQTLTGQAKPTWVDN
jgi:hypothetical protein